MQSGSSTNQVVGRLAPSPTGALHLGHAFSFLIAWWSARQRGGKVVLRLEDVDVGRSSKEYAENCISDLQWLGLDWDQQRLQSSRVDELRALAGELLERGHAYPCVCSRSDITRAVERSASPGDLRYPGTCRGKYASLAEAEQVCDQDAGIRFMAPDISIWVRDHVCPPFSENIARSVGDFLVLRRNKSPCYQLAVVADDDWDGVTEVVRGRDLLESTPRQISLQRQLGYGTPQYYHLPLVCDPAGRKLAKRHDDLSLSQLRDEGVEAAQIVGWVAAEIGLVPLGSRGNAAEFVDLFRWEGVKRKDILLPGDPRTLFES